MRLLSVTAPDEVNPVPDSALADTLLTRLTAAYPAAADPVRAAHTRAYVKDAAAFLGIATPARRALDRTLLVGSVKNHSTRRRPSTMIDVMFRHAFLLAASAVADAPKAAVLIITAAVDGARS